MAKRKLNIGEIFGGIAIVIVMWIICVLSSGTIALGDVLEFWEGSVLLSAFTLCAYVAICALIGAYSKRNGHKSFFVATAVTSALPLIAAVIMFIVSLTEHPLSKWYISLRGSGSSLEKLAETLLFIFEIPILISYPFVMVVSSMAYAFGGESAFEIITGYAIFSIAPIASCLAYRFTKVKE